MGTNLNPVERCITNVQNPYVRQLFQDYYSEKAIVLLGEPGSGKTTEFKKEALRESNAEYVTVRDFLAFQPNKYAGKILYLDALDEQRSRKQNDIEVIDNVVARLEQINCPAFRLSCREADWYGALDKSQLEKVSCDEKVSVLKLSPFDADEIQQAIKGHITEPDTFVVGARHRGIFDFLTNPLTLSMTVEVYKDKHSWPATKIDLFDQFLALLAKEKNAAHASGTKGSATLSEIFDAAGCLCALNIIADVESFALSESEASDKVPFYLDACLTTELKDACKEAVKRRLFKFDGQSFSPVHRAVAEYLAARFIISLTQKGLPIGRVKVLITGGDEGSLSELRGLYAWLCCFSDTYKRHFISRDPLGVILYGDVSLFNTSDKAFLLDQLLEVAREHAWFRGGDWSDRPFGALCTPDMEEYFQQALSDSSLPYSFVDCLVDAVAYGQPLPNLRIQLLNIIMDSTRAYIVRQGALPALINACDTPEGDLRNILTAIHQQAIEDEDQQLRGIILDELFPDRLSPVETLSYLFCDVRESFLGQFRMFFIDRYAEQLPTEAIPQVLDELASMEVASGGRRNWDLRKFLGKLIYKGLEHYGENIELDKMYQWLMISVDEHGFSILDGEDSSLIANWFVGHPDKLLELYAYNLDQLESNNIFRKEYRFWQITASKIPADKFDKYNNLLFSKAAQELDENKSEELFLLAHQRFVSKADFTAQDNNWFFSYLQQNKRFQKLYDRISVCRIDDWRWEHAKERGEREEERAKDVDFLLSRREEIASGEEIRILDKLSLIFFWGSDRTGAESQPCERIEEAFSKEIADIAHQGFINLLFKEEVPTVSELANLSVESKRKTIGYAMLAGMDLFYRDKQSFDLAPSVLKALLILHNVNSTDTDSTWYSQLILSRPKLAEDALLEYFEIMLMHEKAYISGLYALSREDYMESIRENIVTKLLEKHPDAAVEYLSSLITAVQRTTQRARLAVIAEQALEQMALQDWQRSIWLTIAFFDAPAKWEKEYLRFHSVSKEWANLLAFDDGMARAHMCVNSLNVIGETSDLNSNYLAKLVTLLGSCVSPYVSMHEDIVHGHDEREEISNKIRSLIALLGNKYEDEATNALRALREEPSLEKWHDYISHELYQHYRKKRDNNFIPPTFEQTKRVLANAVPLNERDLFELVKAHLEDIKNTLRTDNPPLYRQFWNTQGKQSLTSPKPEDDGRDTLVLALKPRLNSIGISPEREGSYVENKRSDIKAIYKAWNMPIEIKRDYNSELWTAINEQLIGKYLIDPNCGGYGVYLVLWFDEKGKTIPKHPNSLSKPRTPEALKNMLSDLVPDNLKQKVWIMCLDCSRPQS